MTPPAARQRPRSRDLSGERRALVRFGRALAFLLVAGQIVRVTTFGRTEVRLAAIETLPTAMERPDILDRNGRLLAADVPAPSLFADPLLIADPDDVADRMAAIFPDLKPRDLARQLADRSRRFVWIKRSLSPRMAQKIHDMGLPGLAFRYEPRRTYPGVRLAGHVLGTVGGDNEGISGIERLLDGEPTVTTAPQPAPSERPARLALDLGVQHGLEAELADAMDRYRARGAAGLIMDANTGEIRAIASLPGVDPARPTEFQEPERLNRVTGGTYELGSIFKMVTVAMALEHRLATLDTMLDVRVPLQAGRWRFTDPHPASRPLSLRDVFILSSNVGAGMLALEAGADRQRAFLAKLGLTEPMRTEAGQVKAPQLPAHWGRAETITISYGHGMAIAPLQFAAAGAALVNGGFAVTPTLLARDGPPERRRIVSTATSAALRDLMRRNVTAPKGTGRRAEVAGLEIGGKTGTAEIPSRDGYAESSVISSFFAAFPMSAPRFVVFLILFEPQASAETGGQIAAGATAAPATGRLVERVAPLLLGP